MRDWFLFLKIANTLIEELGLDDEAFVTFIEKKVDVQTVQVKTLISDDSGSVILSYPYGNSEETIARRLTEKGSYKDFRFRMLHSVTNPYQRQLLVETPDYSCLSFSKFITVWSYLQWIKDYKIVKISDCLATSAPFGSEIITIHTDNEVYTYSAGLQKVDLDVTTELDDSCDDKCRDEISKGNKDFIALNLFYKTIGRGV